MITKEIAQYHIERHIDFGEALPPEVERYIELHPECQTYLNKMMMVADTLRQVEVEPPPSILVDAVMDTINLREESRQRSWLHTFLNPFNNLYKGTLNFMHEFRIDPVLSREAWPTAFATLTIFIGVFVLPQMKSENPSHLRTAVENKVIAITDEAYQKVEDVAKQLNEFAAGIIRSVSGEGEEEKKEPGDGLGLKFEIPAHRIHLQEAVEQA